MAVGSAFVQSVGASLSQASANSQYDHFGPLVDVSGLLATGTGNAAANVAAINAAINTLAAASGGIVGISVPGTYYINDTIVMKSNVWLKVGPNVTIKKSASTLQCMVINWGALQSTSTTITRDTNIRIFGGGTFDGNGLNQSGLTQATATTPTTNSYLYGIQGEISMCGVDYFVADDLKFLSCNGFCIQCVGNYGKVTNITSDTIRDVFHLGGPSKQWDIENFSCLANDAIIAMNAWDWHRSSPSCGEISNVRIKNVSYYGASGIGGVTRTGGIQFVTGTRTTGDTITQGTGNVRDISIDGFHCTGLYNSAFFQFLSTKDQIQGSEYSGAGQIYNVKISNGYCTVPNSNCNGVQATLVLGTADGQASCLLSNIEFDHCYFDASLGGTNVVALSWPYTGLKCRALKFTNCAFLPYSATNTSCNFANIQSKTILDSIEFDGFVYKGTGIGAGYGYPVVYVNTYDGTNASEVVTLGLYRVTSDPGVTIDTSIASINGIVDNLICEKWALNFTGGNGDNHSIFMAGAVGNIKNGIVRNCYLNNPKELFSIANGATGSQIVKAYVYDTVLIGCTHPILMSGGRQATIRWKGGSIDTPNNLANISGGTLNLSYEDVTSSGTGATTITEASTPIVRIYKADARLGLSLATVTLSPGDSDFVYSTATPSTLATSSGTGAGQYIWRTSGTPGWWKLS